ncbi:MAG: alpha/beta hydrolase [Pirellulales bacterium]
MSSPTTFTRTDCDFLSDGTRCSAWAYRPSDVERPPVVVMAHGFGGVKKFKLPEYAERFAAAGLVVLLFDYRYTGESDGQPRNLINHRLQQADWRAAVAHARTLPDVDQERIGLWGTSFSGGHAIVTAANDPRIAALSIQVPMVDVTACSMRRFGLPFAMQATFHALWDMAQSLLLGRPHEVPIVALPGSFAVLNKRGCQEGYDALVPEGETLENHCPARVCLTSMFYRATKSAQRVRCPALVVLAEKDQLIPPDVVRKAAAKMDSAEVVGLPLDHFEHYQGAAFEEVVALQTEFLLQTLRR